MSGGWRTLPNHITSKFGFERPGNYADQDCGREGRERREKTSTGLPHQMKQFSTFAEYTLCEHKTSDMNSQMSANSV